MQNGEIASIVCNAKIYVPVSVAYVEMGFNDQAIGHFEDSPALDSTHKNKQKKLEFWTLA